MSTETRRRLRIRVEGTVQGVGFRPHVHRLAAGLRVGGWIRNDDRGVLVEAEGLRPTLDEFLARLSADAPPLASVERVLSAEAPAVGEQGFRILESIGPAAAPAAHVPVDSATCDRCLAELLDPSDRRYRYPFVNCTDCGPRLTIIGAVPYDRVRTTMAAFEMCAVCRGEYEDPSDRRFHAEPNACPACGPVARLIDRRGRHVGTDARDDVEAAAAALDAGRIVAIKGLGGYHLACRADRDGVVAVLRARKHREEKPFAVMARDLKAARGLVELGPADEALLCARARPILVAPRRSGAAVVASVAPFSRELGVMLPYTPLHHLLVRDVGAPLVMTSGNLSDEPIAHRDSDAVERLGRVADLLLTHDREIAAPNEDSVLRSRGSGAAPIPVRISRGYVPEGLRLPIPAERPVLACGAELKSTFCLAKGGRAWVGPHIGDLKAYEALASFRDGIARFEALFGVAPEVVAHDLHPDYASTTYALERPAVDHVAIQHHHAHLAACLAEHGEQGPAVGAIYDGAGYGPDGTVWGGELLAGGLRGYDRAGALFGVRLPGGDAAVREPWRMACSWLAAALEEPAPAPRAALEGVVDRSRWESVCDLASSGLASPLTSSVGRLFDAVSALCGLRVAISYEGQAAAELEAVSDPGERCAYPFALVACGEPGGDDPALCLDPRETVRAIVRDIEAGLDAGVVAARFHNGLARATAAACRQEAEKRGIGTVVLSGGAFQNRLLLARTGEALTGSGLRVLVCERLPPNDGGIALGQAAIAAAAGPDEP